MPGTSWCDHRLIVTVEGPQEKFVATVDKPYACIGSHQNSDVFLPGACVPIRCFYVHAERGEIDWVRLWSIDQVEEPKRGRLKPGEPLVFGLYRIFVTLADSDAKTPNPEKVSSEAATNSSAGEAESLPEMKITAYGKEVGRRHLRHRLTVVGRAAPSSIRISSERHSSTHCLFAWSHGELWLVDLLSGGGSKLNGQRVMAARVMTGDVVRLGDVELTYLEMASATGDDLTFTLAESVDPTDVARSAHGSQFSRIDESSQMHPLPPDPLWAKAPKNEGVEPAARPPGRPTKSS